MAKFSPASTIKSLYTVIDGAKLPIDTAAGYAGFLNQSLTNRYFEIEL